MRDFDSHFNKIQKRSDTIFKVAAGAWVVGVLVGLAGLAAVVYVVVHFLTKFW